MSQKNVTHTRLLAVVRAKGWTQEGLAQKVHSSRQTVHRWLTGKVPPSRNSLLRVAEATDCNLEWLLTGKGEMFLPSVVSTQEEIDAFSAEMQEGEDGYLDFDEEMELEREKEVAQLLAKASAVLKFKFKHNTQCHSDSLAAAITALYRAIKLEEKFIPKRGLMALKKSGRK